MSYQCSLCDTVFESVPAGAVQISKGRGNKVLYQFPDGRLHDLYKTGMGRKASSQKVRAKETK